MAYVSYGYPISFELRYSCSGSPRNRSICYLPLPSSPAPPDLTDSETPAARIGTGRVPLSHVTAASQHQRAAPHPHWPGPTNSPFAAPIAAAAAAAVGLHSNVAARGARRRRAPSPHRGPGRVLLLLLLLLRHRRRGAETAAPGAAVPPEPPLLRAPRGALHRLPASGLAAAPHRRRRRGGGGGGGRGGAAAVAPRGRPSRGDAVLVLQPSAARVRRREPARGREIRAAAVGHPRARQGSARECSTTYTCAFSQTLIESLVTYLLPFRCSGCEFRYHWKMSIVF